MSTPTVTLMGRDAGWYRRPNTRAPKKLHIARPGLPDLAVARCDPNLPLDERTAAEVSIAVALDMNRLCRRCRRTIEQKEPPR